MDDEERRRPTPAMGMPASTGAPVSGDALQVLTQLVASVSDLGNDVRGARGDVQALRDEVGKLQASDKHLMNEVSEIRIRTARIEERVKYLENERSSDKTTIDRFGHETAQALDGVKTHIANVDVQIAEIKTNDSRQNAALDELKSNDAIQTTKLDELKANDASQNAVLAELATVAKQTKVATTALVRLVKSPRIVLYATLGAFVAGALMAIAEKVMH